MIRERDRPCVLIVDDDVHLVRLVRTILQMEEFDVLSAADGEEALLIAARKAPDVIVLDLRMPRLDGRSFYRQLRARGIDTPVLISSAYGARSAQVELGAQASIEKPFEPELLVQAITDLLTSRPRS